MRPWKIYEVSDRIALRSLWQALRDYAGHREPLPCPELLADAVPFRQGLSASYFNYGRNALHTLFRERFGGKEIILPGFISPSLALAAVAAGARPLFAEASLADFNLDVDLISDEELQRADAILVNHTFGVPVNMEKVRERVTKHDLYVIEDVAQALFARYKGAYVGGLGDAVLLSMYKQTPNLHGAILLSDHGVARPQKDGIELGDLFRALYLAPGLHGYLIDSLRRWKTPSSKPGTLGDQRLPHHLSLLIFRATLPRLEQSTGRKRVIAECYTKRAQQSKYLIPQRFDQESEPSWFNFSVRLVPELSHFRDRLFLALRRRGIFCGRLWHDSPVVSDAFKEYHRGQYPNAALLSRSVINLPIKAGYTEGDVDYLFDTIEEVISRFLK